MARRARLATRDPSLVLADGRAGTAGQRPTRLVWPTGELPVAVRLVLRGLKARRPAALNWPRPGGANSSVARSTRQAAATCSGVRSRRQSNPAPRLRSIGVTR
jgi:hypothetical protein